MSAAIESHLNSPHWKLAGPDRSSPPTLRNAGPLGLVSSYLGGKVSGGGRVDGLLRIRRDQLGGGQIQRRYDHIHVGRTTPRRTPSRRTAPRRGTRPTGTS